MIESRILSPNRGTEFCFAIGIKLVMDVLARDGVGPEAGRIAKIESDMDTAPTAKSTTFIVLFMSVFE